MSKPSIERTFHTVRPRLRNRFLLTAVAAAVFTTASIATGSASAQSWSNYNRSQTLNLIGEVQSIRYRNPIVTLQPQAGEQVWQAFLASPAQMQQRGLPQTALRVGQTVRLVGFPDRAQANQMRVEQIAIDQQAIELR
ncbi:hypothetical protein H6F67_19520 [Microcoleus sp. FACHB-1515]|uniref:DUF6152 family protein n=1 Tax=Cyanophyceae TaxID=3028117 RepID=UPI0016851875|nr:DUF6152 family protein [Microcoleus sp. FACHB-1515]MBD2092041.1 hypothetical protein [Microcoleus sp. FACHB-1515]